MTWAVAYTPFRACSTWVPTVKGSSPSRPAKIGSCHYCPFGNSKSFYTERSVARVLGLVHCLTARRTKPVTLHHQRT